MSSLAITTVIKMMESVPESVQNRIVEHLSSYLEDLQDETEWDSLISETQPKLIEAARLAKQEISEGKATPMDYSRL